MRVMSTLSVRYDFKMPYPSKYKYCFWKFNTEISKILQLVYLNFVFYEMGQYIYFINLLNNINLRLNANFCLAFDLFSFHILYKLSDFQKYQSTMTLKSMK